jgi:predicted O-methyltransferase YrrM
VVTRSTWSDVDRYFERGLIAGDEALNDVMERCAAARLPPIAVSPSQGKLLFILARAIAARRILEIGTLGGYSTVWLARALPADGRIVTIEVNPSYADVARSNFDRVGVSRSIDLRVGSALTLLPQLAAEHGEAFDLSFIDADRVNQSEYFDWAIRLSRPGSLIIVDNVVREGAVIDAASTDASVQGVRRFMEALAADRRVEATAIQTVGHKGYDGFAAAIVL